MLSSPIITILKCSFLFCFILKADHGLLKLPIKWLSRILEYPMRLTSAFLDMLTIHISLMSVQYTYALVWYIQFTRTGSSMPMKHHMSRYWKLCGAFSDLEEDGGTPCLYWLWGDVPLTLASLMTVAIDCNTAYEQPVEMVGCKVWYRALPYRNCRMNCMMVF